ncbi:MAG: type II toxin-antitoxin system HicB family antitoxin [Actinomycetota bacterium]
MQEAIALHIASLRKHGEPVPEPRSSVRYLAV